MGFHTLFFACALFSKETGLFFPVLAVLHQRLVVRAPLTRPQSTALTADGVIVIVWAVLRAQALAGSPAPSMLDTLRIASANAPQLLVQAGKWLMPARLNVAPGVDTVGLAAGTVALIVLAGVTWRRVPRGMTIVGACWALAFLLPTLLVPGLPAYEHRNYLPLIGVSIAGSFFSRGRRDAETQRQTPSQRALGVSASPRPVSTAVVCVVIAVFAACAYQRLDVFEHPFAYWTDASRNAQFGPVAHVNLGRLHELEDRPDHARREYVRALELDPATPKAHNNLGVVLMRMDQPEQALRHFREEVRRHPSNAEAWFNLGLFAEQRGDPAEARRNYERAIAQNRFYRPAYEKLGRSEQIPNPKSQIPK